MTLERSSWHLCAVKDIKTCITLATATLLIATVAAAVGTALPKLPLAPPNSGQVTSTQMRELGVVRR